MVGTVYGTRPSETETAEVEAVQHEELVKQDQLETAEVPRLGTQGVSLPVKAIGSAQPVDTKIVTFPARRVTIEGTRVVNVIDPLRIADSASVATTRPTAGEVNERG